MSNKELTLQEQTALVIVYRVSIGNQPIQFLYNYLDRLSADEETSILLMIDALLPDRDLSQAILAARSANDHAG